MRITRPFSSEIEKPGRGKADGCFNERTLSGPDDELPSLRHMKRLMILCLAPLTLGPGVYLSLCIPGVGSSGQNSIQNGGLGRGDPHGGRFVCR